MAVNNINFIKYLIPIESENVIFSSHWDELPVTTNDFVALGSAKRLDNVYFKLKRKSMTDFAFDNGQIISDIYMTLDEKPAGRYFIMECNPDRYIDNRNVGGVASSGKYIFLDVDDKCNGIVPNIKLDFRPFITNLIYKKQKRGSSVLLSLVNIQKQEFQKQKAENLRRCITMDNWQKD